MQIQATAVVTTRKESLLGRLARVYLPGRPQARAQAASKVPLWLAAPLLILSLILLAEIIVYNVQVIEQVSKMTWTSNSELFDNVPRNQLTMVHRYAWENLEPRILPGIFERPMLAVVALLGLGVNLVCLEALNLLVFAPFSTPFGQKLRANLGKSRKVLYMLGGYWVLQLSIVWTLAIVFVAPRLTQVIIDRQMPQKEGFVMLGFGAILPLALLLVWALRVLRAASLLSSGAAVEPAVRCSECGYFLEGLAPNAACPECGLPNPGRADQVRRPSIWARLHGLGRLPALATVVLTLPAGPGRFFRRMQVLGQTQESRRFLTWSLCLSMLIGLVAALPALLWADLPNPYDKVTVSYIAVLIALICLICTLCMVPVLGLLISLLGLAICRTRQEAAWPIGAAAGAYLAGLLPWIYAAQALWLWLMIALDRNTEIGEFCRVLARNTRIHWIFFLAVIYIAPAIIGLILLIRLAVVCYKSVRYACR